MATVDRDIAEREIKRCKKQKRPRMYCIVSYHNTIFDKKCYSICFRRKDYDGLKFSGTASDIKILWQSEKCYIDKVIESLDRGYEKMITKQDDRWTARLIKKHG